MGWFSNLVERFRPKGRKGSKWDKEEILEYARRASWAYNEETTIKEKYPQAVVHTTKETKVRYFIDLDNVKRIAWVAVRGTAGIENALMDAEYDKKKSKTLGLYLHNGFRKLTREIWYGGVKDYLETIPSDYKIRVTGHSLGGAIAVILSMYLKKDEFNLDKCITFGQPKVTNKKGSWKYRRLPVVRVVHDNDPVPRVPPVSFIGAKRGIYHHLGAMLMINDDGTIKSFDRKEAGDPLVNSLWDRAGSTEVDDHKMDNYIKAIKENL
jgi:hypothetical protein